ncbi:MAG TPA: FGGY-family carbohydrate kinase [Capillimicrobium sp.]|jgi:xylulokinase
MTAEGELVLGLDIGTSSSKAVLARPDGTVVASAQRAHGLSLPRPGWAEHDAEAIWWADVLALCDALVPQARGALAGVCVSGIGPCVVPCDAALRPLRPAILYGIDMRAGAEIDELERRYGPERILERAGSALSSQALGPKLLWLQRHEPEVWQRAAGWYMASSYAVARLTGEYVLDHHSASQCAPLYDLAAGRWDEAWAAETAPGVPLPALAWPWDPVGTVTPDASRLTGIRAGTPVMAGTIDAWAEALSVGARRPGDLMLMYGSTMFMIGVLDRPRVHAGLWGTAGATPGSWSLAAGMATSGTLTDWVRRLAGEQDFDALVEEAAAVEPGAHGLLALPYFAGERSPIFDPRARGVLAGLTLTHQRGHVLRAVYEATALGVRHNIAAYAGAGFDIGRVIAVGGGTKAPLWTQIVSDVTGLTQQVPGETIGAAYGDALLAAVGAGLASPEDDWATIVGEVKPQPAHEPLYDELFTLYLELYRATAGVAHRLAALQERAAVLRAAE